LRDLEKKCLAANSDSDRAFQILMKVWDKVAAPLFDLGYWQDFVRCCKIVFHVAHAIDHIGAQAQTLNEMGWLLMESGDFDTARQYFKDALQKYTFLQEARGECRSLRYLGVLSHRQKQIDLAVDYYYQALERVKVERMKAPHEERNTWAMSEAELHNMLGIYYIQLEDFPASYRELTLSLKQYRSIEDPYYRYYHTAPLINLGKWYFLQQDYENARRYYNECLELSKEIRRTDTSAGVLLRLAEVAAAEGKLDEALQLATESERTAGTEIALIREQAASFKEEILQQNQGS
jgi:tetratricopeptide (TPR) repeat protein